MLAALSPKRLVTKAFFRFLEEEAEELNRLHKEHAAGVKLKQELQIERERMVRACRPACATLSEFR